MFTKTIKKLLVLTSLSVIITGLPAFSLTIEPRYEQVKVNERVQIFCKSDVPLAGCQFKRANSSDFYELSDGSANSSTNNYHYIGDGLQKGVCGIDLVGNTEKKLSIIGCRVRSETGAWQYLEMLLYVTDYTSFNYSFKTPTISLNPGSSVSLASTSSRRDRHSLTRCSFKPNWPDDDKWINFNEGHQSMQTSDYRYYGEGLKQYGCGITLVNVNMSRFIISLAAIGPLGSNTIQWASVDFVSMRVKNPLKLTTDRNEYDEGELLIATCEINSIQSVSQVSWYLNKEIIKEDLIDDSSPASAWRWSYGAPIKQSLTRKMTWSDDGKILECKTQETSENSSIQIKVKYKPIEVSLEPFFLIEGQAGVIQVEVKANPSPTLFKWILGNKMIFGNVSNTTSRIYTIHIPNNEKNVFKSFLHFNPMTLEDFNKNISLNVTNVLGSTIYTITIIREISTSTDYLSIIVIILAVILALILASIAFMIFLLFTRRFKQKSPLIPSPPDDPIYDEIKLNDIHRPSS